MVHKILHSCKSNFFASTDDSFCSFFLNCSCSLFGHSVQVVKRVAASSFSYSTSKEIELSIQNYFIVAHCREHCGLILDTLSEVERGRSFSFALLTPLNIVNSLCICLPLSSMYASLSGPNGSHSGRLI